jgi:argininosuccinate lyase
VELATCIEEFRLYSQVDAAHLCMLEATGLIESSTRRSLAQAIFELVSEDFATLAGREAPRGLYIAYQDEVARRAGADHTMFLHTGRSRNDLNATVLALRLRRWSIEALEAIDLLRDALLQTAFRLDAAPLPIFSQYQIAGPGQAWHYFASLEASLVQMRQAVLPSIDALSICPLGAGAGAGTSLPIDPALTAKLLGFDRPVDLSLRAVAGREAALMLSAALALPATVIGRSAQDFQLWLMPGLELGDLPDGLSGTSSILPHKRNPYLLEHMKSLSAQVTVASMECTTTCLKVPFCNSVEVSSYLPSILQRQTRSFTSLCYIAQSVVGAIDLGNGSSRASCNVVHATQVLAEQRALSQGTSVARQHHDISVALRAPGHENLSPWLADLDIPRDAKRGGEVDLSVMLKYGGGPGSPERTTIVEGARRHLTEDRDALSQLSRAWRNAELRRDEVLRELSS